MAALVGCAADWRTDGVLWRQLVGQKASLHYLWAPDHEPLTEEQVVEAVQGGNGVNDAPWTQDAQWLYWQPSEDTLSAPLDAGAVIFYDYVSAPGHEAEVGALLYSGTRNAAADSLAGRARDASYAGPTAVYTCERLVLEYSTGVVRSVRLERANDPEECPRELTELLPDGAVYAEPVEFDG